MGIDIVMEELNKSFDLDEKFEQIEKLLETFKENGYSEEYEGIAIKVVNGLTDILEKGDTKKLNTEIVNRFANLLIK